MKRIDYFARAHAQRRMRAAIGVDREKARAQIDPEFGIAFAEADGARANDELLVADGAEHRLIEPHRGVEIANCDGDVIDHAPERTSL